MSILPDSQATLSKISGVGYFGQGEGSLTQRDRN